MHPAFQTAKDKYYSTNKGNLDVPVIPVAIAMLVTAKHGRNSGQDRMTITERTYNAVEAPSPEPYVDPEATRALSRGNKLCQATV